MSRPAPPRPVSSRPGKLTGIELPVRALGFTLGVAVLCALSCEVGLLLAQSGSGPSLFWPPAGVALAAIVRLGRSAIPGLVLGIGVVAIGRYGLPSAAVIVAGSVGAAALGGWLIRRRGRDRLSFDRISDVGLLTVAAVVQASVGAAITSSTLVISGGLETASIGREAVAWWLGDVSGSLLIAPVLLGATGRNRVETSRQPHVEAIATWTGLAVCVAVAVWFTFAPNVLRFPATTACLPFVAIAAVRFGPRGAALANLFTSGVVVGIILIANRPEFNVVLVAFLAVSSTTALSLGAVTAERDAAVARLAADIAARVAAEKARKSAEVERTIAEEALEADRKRFAALLEHSHDAIVVMSPDGRTAFVSDAVARLTGRDPETLVGRSTFEHVHPEDLAEVRITFAHCLAHPGITAKAEFRVRTVDDRWVWLEAIGSNHLDNPAVPGVVVNIRDVTERRETEDRLRDARGLLEATGRLARIGGWEYVIPDDRLVWSEQTYRIHGVTPGQYTPTVADALNFYAPEARPIIRAAVERGMAIGAAWNLVLPFDTDTGRRLWVNSIGHVEQRDGKPYRLFGTFQDVTERVESECAVQESESRYQNLFESAPVAIWEEDLSAIAEWFDSLRAGGVTDLAAHLAANPGLPAVVARMIRVRDVNYAAVAMNRAADKAELIGNLHRLFIADTLGAFSRELVAIWNGERTVRIEGRTARLDGTSADVVLHLRIPERANQPDFTRVVVIILDVTEQKRLEEQYRQSQKLEAIGRLAGGIAHDFNNLLTVINGFAELILANAGVGGEVHDLAAHIRDAGGRAADLTRQLLAFSRKHPAPAGPIDVAVVIGGLCPLLAPLLGSAIRLHTRLSSVPPVRIDKGQFEQVVMNLVVNARDAMPSGGMLTLATAVVEVDHYGVSNLPTGRWIMISVADTGTGIREDVQPHLFEPFFTTKELGQGTGLGLSTVYGIVTTAGGHLRYETALGQGTTFRVYLPAAEERSRETIALPQPETKGPVDTPLRGVGLESFRIKSDASTQSEQSLRVLLVEDVPAVRSFALQIMHSAGFRVTDAASGEDALEKLAALPESPDLLITDIQMPGMDGRELAGHVRAMRPGIRVLFMSGFASEAIQPAELDGSHEAFLAKPFTAEELIRAVTRLIEGVQCQT